MMLYSFAGGKLVGGLAFNNLGHGLSLGLVQLHQLGKIELGFLEDLDLLDKDVLEGEDLGAVLGDLLGNGVSKATSIY